MEGRRVLRLSSPMEDQLPAFAHWLGAHALAFFALATAGALIVLGTLWYLLVRHTKTLVQWAMRQWSPLAGHRAVQWMHAKTSRWSWLAAYLTAYVVIAVVTAAIGLALFFGLADEVSAGEDIAAFDDAFTASLRESTSRTTLVLFELVTHLGDPPFLTGVSALVALTLIWRRQRMLAAIWIAATAGNGLITRGLKAIFERTRPVHDHGVASYEGWSFPSGHASASLAVYTMLLYVILRGRDLEWWHLPALVAAMALILVVGFSRVFLQVHYLSDVLGGYLVAATWLCICISAAELARTYQSRRPTS